MAISSGLGLDGLNSLTADQAQGALLGCCASPEWARSMTAGRPYGTVEELLAAADAALDRLPDREFDAALAGHPRIGERSTSGRSAQEQSGVEEASRAALMEGNREYEARFGHVYLVCAAGRTGEELLAALHQRLGNDPATERLVVREELRKINRLRLEALVRP
jgi:2-oxo-4-hydroxy-4-carboxy-5-ureidoimidazoline decarboxylase